MPSQLLPSVLPPALITARPPTWVCQLPQVAFEEGRVATPELTADLQLPSSLDVLGQRVDLAPLQVRLLLWVGWCGASYVGSWRQAADALACSTAATAAAAAAHQRCQTVLIHPPHPHPLLCSRRCSLWRARCALRWARWAACCPACLTCACPSSRFRPPPGCSTRTWVRGRSRGHLRNQLGCRQLWGRTGAM